MLLDLLERRATLIRRCPLLPLLADQDGVYSILATNLLKDLTQPISVFLDDILETTHFGWIDLLVNEAEKRIALLR